MPPFSFPGGAESLLPSARIGDLSTDLL